MSKNTLGIKILCLCLATTFSFGAEYIVPPDYDNLVASSNSVSKSLLLNTSPLGVSGNIAGKTVTYRCVSIPKIDCRGSSSPEIITVISEVSLKEPVNNELVHVFTTDIITNDAGTSFDVCGVAVGGMVWDTSTLEKQTNTAGEEVLVYKYEPNTQADIYYFFSGEANKGSLQSYMTIETKQTCR